MTASSEYLYTLALCLIAGVGGENEGYVEFARLADEYTQGCNTAIIVEPCQLLVEGLINVTAKLITRRSALALGIIRYVDLTVYISRSTKYDMGRMSDICSQKGIPLYIVTLRHEIVHRHVPQLPALIMAAQDLLKHSIEVFWCNKLVEPPHLIPKLIRDDGDLHFQRDDVPPQTLRLFNDLIELLVKPHMELTQLHSKVVSMVRDVGLSIGVGKLLGNCIYLMSPRQFYDAELDLASYSMDVDDGSDINSLRYQDYDEVCDVDLYSKNLPLQGLINRPRAIRYCIRYILETIIMHKPEEYMETFTNALANRETIRAEPTKSILSTFQLDHGDTGKYIDNIVCWLMTPLRMELYKGNKHGRLLYESWLDLLSKLTKYVSSLVIDDSLESTTRENCWHLLKHVACGGYEP